MKVVLGTDPIRYPLTGIGRYTYELGSRLAACDRLEDIRFMRAGRLLQKLPGHPEQNPGAGNASWTKKLIGRSTFMVGVYRQIEEFVQRRQLSNFSEYIYHGPNYYLPLHSGPCVSTFHDLSVFQWADCHPVARVRYMQKELPLAIKRADVLLTDSEYTRREIAEFFGWPIDRIVVAPLAASSMYRPMTEPEVVPFLKRLGLQYKSYCLFVGTLDPRKNIDLLLNVYEHMPNARRTRIPLVVIGFDGWKSERTRQRLLKGQSEGWARYAGFVDEAALPALYAAARVFVFPSRYEGFGLPVLEAMAAGVPVISSNAASLPEVTGGDEFAVLLSPEDETGFAEAMHRAFVDDRWCQERARKGIERASSFSWDSTLLGTLDAYDLAMER